jgi:hypothetical protein
VQVAKYFSEGDRVDLPSDLHVMNINVTALTWLTIGACLVYVVAIDSNVYTWLVLLSKSATIWLRKKWFLVRHNPDSPWVRWAIDRNANRLAKELSKEYENK